MNSETLKCVNRRKDDNSGGSNTGVPSNENVPPEDRRDAVLEFIYEHDMALPPLAIFAGMKRQEGIHFSYRTVQNILSDLIDGDLVQRVDTNKLRSGEGIEPVDGGEGRRSYYFITEAGRREVEQRIRE